MAGDGVADEEVWGAGEGGKLGDGADEGHGWWVVGLISYKRSDAVLGYQGLLQSRYSVNYT